MPTLFPFQPTGLLEKIRFKTDIRMTSDGEWRDSLIDGDYILAMDLTLIHQDAARLEGLIRSNPDEDFYVPLWQDCTRVVSTISSGATTVAVNTDADYRAGGFAAIIKDDQTAEVVTVTSATGGTLTCSAISQTYTADESSAVFVMPLVQGVLPGGFGRSDSTAVSQISATFLCPDPLDIAAGTYPTHRTYDVCTDDVIVFSPLEGALQQALAAIENGFGHITLEEIESYARHYWTMTAFDTTQAGRFARRQWMHRLRGRDTPFWLPSWKRDLPLRTTLASGGTTARVQRISPVNADMVGRSVQFLLEDGTVIHREITSAADVGGDSTSVDLGLAAPGQEVPTTAIVSLMHLVRLDADEIEITHTAANDSIHSALSVPVVEIQA